MFWTLTVMKKTKKTNGADKEEDYKLKIDLVTGK